MTAQEATMQQRYTVGEIAEQFGVTVRTLHHYDQIGLLRPSELSSAGYRIYTDEDLVRLQHIVVYRRLELSLDEIATLLESGDVATHLRRQRDAVMARQDELHGLVAAIDNALEKTMTDQPIATEDLKRLFGDSYEDDQQEAEQRWHDAEAWKESQRRTKGYTKADWQQIKAEADQLQSHLAAVFQGGAAADSAEAMDAVEAHRAHLNQWFMEVSPQFHRCLGDLYVSDPRYTAAYDEAYDAAGLAAWVREAIYANADRRAG